MVLTNYTISNREPHQIAGYVGIDYMHLEKVKVKVTDQQTNN